MALKVAEAAPAGTVTEAGAVSRGLLLASKIAIPPAGAAILSAAEQVEICAPFRLPGAHVIEERAGTTTMAPVVVNESSPEPVAATPTGFEMPTDVVVALTANVSCTFATTPAAIAFAFKPASTQENTPGTEAHESVFPAAVATGPAVAPIAEI